jgi:TonB family protein
MNTLNYFVEANLCLLAFYLVFRLFLYHETVARFNRMFLLGALLLSVIVPLLHLGRLDEIPAMGSAIAAYLLPEFTVGDGTSPQSEEVAHTTLGAWGVIAIIYLGVCALLFLRLLYRCVRLWAAIRNAHPIAEADDIKILAVEEHSMTFSVFNYIILGDPSSLGERESNLIIRHEIVHVRKGHTWDILIAELICIVFWFNPAVWAIKRQLGDVHEYEADQHAAQGEDVQEYCSLLARIALQSQGFALVAHFNRSSTLKRIQMMKAVKNKISGWKIAALVPIIAGVLGFVACQDQVIDDLNTVAQNSSVALDVPRLVQARYDQLRQEKPDSRFVIMEIRPEGISKLNELEQKYGLPASMEVFKFSEDLQSIVGGPIKGSSDAGVIVDVGEGNNNEAGRSFMILEYNDRVESLSNSTSQDGEVFLVVEETAQPNGGIEQFYAFVNDNMSYPSEARQSGIEGRVFIEFVVEKDGTLTNFKTLKGIGHGCDQEAIRVLSMSPPWNPGKQRGQPVRQKMVMPIVFNL